MHLDPGPARAATVDRRARNAPVGVREVPSHEVVANRRADDPAPASRVSARQRARRAMRGPAAARPRADHAFLDQTPPQVPIVDLAGHRALPLGVTRPPERSPSTRQRHGRSRNSGGRRRQNADATSRGTPSICRTG